MKKQFINGIRLDRTNIDPQTFPYHLNCLQHFHELTLDHAVTFFCGENGSGKSTFLEAVAIACGINPEGGSNNMQFSTYDDYSDLHRHLRLQKWVVPQTKFFLRAESFYNVATEISNNQLLSLQYGGDLHQCSHGESFLRLVENRFWDQGLYILDEPEAALSAQGQITLLCHIHRLAQNGSQFLIATHSPILLGYQYGVIHDMDRSMAVVAYEDTAAYQTYRAFLNHPRGIQQHLFEET